MKKTPLTACCVVLTAFCSLVFTECKKSDDNSSKSKLLKSATWKFSKAGILNNGTETTIATAALPIQACDLDDNVTFKTDTTGVVDEGPSICPTTTTGQTSVFKYTYNSSTDILNFNPAIYGVISEAKVLEITSTQLRASTTVTGVPFPVVVTLIH